MSHHPVRRPGLPRVAAGAVVSALAATLLTGGGATFAGWRAADGAAAGSFAAGALRLTVDAVNTGCGTWVFVSSPTSTGVYSGQPLQPGDILSLDCHYTLRAAGDHLSGRMSVSTGASTLPPGVTLDATAYTVNGVSSATAPTFTSGNDGQEAGVTITLTVPADPAPPMASSVVLSAVLVTVTQESPEA